MAIKRTNTNFHYNNAQKTNKNFMYSDLRRANCYNSEFSGSNFKFASFRGAHFKSCDFYGCDFEGTEFIGTNLKKSKFKKAEFKDVIFEGVNLEGVDFLEATFENVIFLDTDISKANNMKFKETDVKIYEEMPKIDLSEALEKAIELAMENKYIKKSRVLDTKEGTINHLSILRLLDKFKEKDLIIGLKLSGERINRDFSTLSYIVRAMESYRRDGLI